MPRILVQAEDFDAGAELARLTQDHAAGAVASFLGIVRSGADRPIAAMTLEHYPGMTERALGGIAQEAMQRFELLDCTIIHRVGRLLPGERIVLAAAAAPHRHAALAAVSFLMDCLKTGAPFWKHEVSAGGEGRWVEAKAEDDTHAARWQVPPGAS